MRGNQSFESPTAPPTALKTITTFPSKTNYAILAHLNNQNPAFVVSNGTNIVKIQQIHITFPGLMSTAQVLETSANYNELTGRFL
jgi:hypothetical protein